MINDSIREELKTKVSAAAKPASFEAKRNFPMSNQMKPSANPVNLPKSSAAKSETSAIASAPTSPTLVEFHNKNSAVPEWRLQLQNTVRQRQGRAVTGTEKANSSTIPKTKLVTSGATALKVKTIEQTILTDAAHDYHPTLTSALERINTARQKFLTAEEENKPAPAAPPVAPQKTYPFQIAGKTAEAAPKKAQINAAPNFSVKPTLAPPLKNEKEDLDTNKLPPLPQLAKISTSFEKRPSIAAEEIPRIEENIKIEEEVTVEIKTVVSEEISAAEQTEIEETDDCAPFSLRFNAGIFDLIFGAFASLLLLSPFMIFGTGGWFTFAGFAGFLATCAVVMFIYLTTSIGMYGKTFGMHLFSLELIDVEGENYPTMHQAAVSSSLYLLSLALGGAGFLTLFFNDEKRAVHDLVSRTVVVREF